MKTPEPSSSTLSQSEAEAGLRAEAPVPRLVLVLCGDRPLDTSACFSLEGLEQVTLGRGSELRAVREGTKLQIKVPDSRMSSEHASLQQVLGRWVLEDAGSKNGVLLNGTPQRRAALEPGDSFELGQTVLLYQERFGAVLEGAPSQGLAAEHGLSTFVPELAEDMEALAQVARSRVSVVLYGETGTGKEVAARAVHALSGRAGAFVAVNCGALPGNLVESELFGYRKGAFTGALEDRPGLIRSSAGGTLFLDEVAELPLPLQVAFLRVLQEEEVTAVGATTPHKVDLRVVAATHRDLEAAVERGTFRADLYARLSGFTVRLPALRERREDIGLLVGALLRRRLGPGVQPTLSRDAVRALVQYGWPLNVRELEKALELALVLSKDAARIELNHLPLPVQVAARPQGSVPSRGKGTATVQQAHEPTLAPAEAARRDQLIAMLREHRGNVSAVARTMGLARMQIQRWLKRYRIDAESFRGPAE